ncbi:MAG: ATP-binding cassette domain-containing protein [Dorea formicigenerans]
MVFQEPMTSLNPVITIGVQMARAMRLHQKLEKQKVREKSIQLLEKVGIKHAEKTLYAYPHEVSGGMRQRIMIAMAMINKPSLLICDEPTSALDVIVQDQIIKLIKSLCVQEEMAVLFITHDMSVVAQIADQIAVMHHGKIVESDEKKRFCFARKMNIQSVLFAMRWLCRKKKMKNRIFYLIKLMNK